MLTRGFGPLNVAMVLIGLPPTPEVLSYARRPASRMISFILWDADTEVR